PPPGAALLVVRVGGVPALVADRGGDHAGHLPERLLLAPEAAERELGDLAALRVRRQQWRTEHRVQLRHGHGRVATRQCLLRPDHLRLPEPENAHRASFGNPSVHHNHSTGTPVPRYTAWRGDAIGGVSHSANRFAPVGHNANSPQGWAVRGCQAVLVITKSQRDSKAARAGRSGNSATRERAPEIQLRTVSLASS